MSYYNTTFYGKTLTGNVKFSTGNGGKTEFWLKKGVQKSVENDDYEKNFSAKSFFWFNTTFYAKKVTGNVDF